MKRNRGYEKVYFDNSADDCVWRCPYKIKDAEVISARVCIYSMPVFVKNKEYERYAQDYDIHFIFDDSVAEIDFYVVPRIDVLAMDSESGFICTIGGMNDFQSEAAICYIDKDR